MEYKEWLRSTSSETKDNDLSLNSLFMTSESNYNWNAFILHNCLLLLNQFSSQGKLNKTGKESERDGEKRESQAQKEALLNPVIGTRIEREVAVIRGQYALGNESSLLHTMAKILNCMHPRPVWSYEEFLQDSTAMVLYLLVFWGKDDFNHLKNLINRLCSINLEVKENKSDGTGRTEKNFKSFDTLDATFQ
uniref:Uncharacterized protein n=1 Tax=Salix viminalis TaxID=40686 RepID=A0A6N2NA96_SALVM